MFIQNIRTKDFPSSSHFQKFSTTKIRCLLNFCSMKHAKKILERTLWNVRLFLKIYVYIFGLFEQ